jgi:hypothetical protein
VHLIRVACNAFSGQAARLLEWEVLGVDTTAHHILGLSLASCLTPPRAHRPSANSKNEEARFRISDHHTLAASVTVGQLLCTIYFPNAIHIYPKYQTHLQIRLFQSLHVVAGYQITILNSLAHCASHFPRASYYPLLQVKSLLCNRHPPKMKLPMHKTDVDNGPRPVRVGILAIRRILHSNPVDFTFNVYLLRLPCHWVTVQMSNRCGAKRHSEISQHVTVG